MIGNQIYLIFCRDMVHHSDTMETPHATFDGVYEHMQAIKEHYDLCDRAVRVQENVLCINKNNREIRLWQRY